MPQAAELPASLAQLAHRQALELSPNRFGSDTARLLQVLDRTLNEMGVGPAGPLTDTGRPLGRDTNYRGTHAEAQRSRDEAGSPQPQAPPPGPSAGELPRWWPGSYGDLVSRAFDEVHPGRLIF